MAGSYRQRGDFIARAGDFFFLFHKHPDEGMRRTWVCGAIMKNKKEWGNESRI